MIFLQKLMLKKAEEATYAHEAASSGKKLDEYKLIRISCFFISNAFISNTRLKLAKNQAKA